MGLSKPAQPGDAPAAAPAERFDEAAAYAREEAASNANTGASAGAPKNETPAATSAAASAPAGTPPSTTPPAGQAPPEGHQTHKQAQHGHQPEANPPNGGQWANPGNPSQPVQGVPVRGPTQTPPPQQVVIGYMLVAPQDDCSCDLRLEGWLVVLILLLTFPCFAWIPCVIPDCFQPYQVPIYGPPGSHPVPVASPYYG